MCTSALYRNAVSKPNGPELVKETSQGVLSVCFELTLMSKLRSNFLVDSLRKVADETHPSLMLLSTLFGHCLAICINSVLLLAFTPTEEIKISQYISIASSVLIMTKTFAEVLDFKIVKNHPKRLFLL